MMTRQESTMAPPRTVYVAHPMTTYATPWARRCVAAITTALPGADLIDPEHAGWGSSAEWLAAWGQLIEALDLLVIFTAQDLSVGAGCLRELADALAWDVPVAVLGARRRLCALGTITVLPEAERTPMRTATITAGSVLR